MLLQCEYQEMEKLRKDMLSKRSSLKREEIYLCSERAMEYIRAYEPFQSAEWVFGYCECRKELPIRGILEEGLAAGKHIALPRVIGPGEMAFYEVKDLRQDLEPGAFGISEPKEHCPEVMPKEHSLLLIPGSVFDLRGNRMGYGGGFYDRYLENKTDTCFLGVCYSFQIVPQLKPKKTDVPVHGLLTEKGIFVTGETVAKDL